jgi:hypothetical protein
MPWHAVMGRFAEAGSCSGQPREFLERLLISFGAGCADDAEEDFFEGKLFSGLGKADAGAQFVERAVRDELAFLNDGDVAAEALDDLEDMRSEEDGDAALDHALEHGFEGACGDGVDAFERLVEKEDARRVDDSGSEREFLLHTVGKVGDEFFRFAGEVHEVEQFFRAPVGGVAIEAIHAADEAEVLGRCEAAEEGKAFRDDADLAFELKRVRREVEAEQLNLAGCGREQAGEHFDCRGLPSAVRAEKAEELPGRDAEADAVNGGELAEATGKVVRGNGWSVHLGQG